MDPRRLFTPQSEWLRASIACQLLGLGSVRTIEREIEAGRLPFRTARLGARGMLFVNSDDLNRYRAQLLARPATGVPA